jgi:hypothetical protein
VTRDAGNLVTVALANGTEIRATNVHPVWSVDREEWVPAGELEPGELVDTLTGPVAVLSVERLESALDVYNIEVHGEHVFRVTADGVLVHNTCIEPNTAAWTSAINAIRNAGKGIKVNLTVRTATEAKQLLAEALGNMNRYGNYAHDALSYEKGFEVHNVMNARELAVHDLQHIKWFANNTSGHIFYRFPN